MSMAPKDLDRLNIGKPDDAGGTETEGTVNAKLNALLNEINEGVRTVKSVQFGAAQNFSLQNAITISEVDVKKTVILLQGGVQNPSFFPIYVKDVTSTSFTVGSYNYGSTLFYFSWYVIEFY